MLHDQYTGFRQQINKDGNIHSTISSEDPWNLKKNVWKQKVGKRKRYTIKQKIMDGQMDKVNYRTEIIKSEKKKDIVKQKISKPLFCGRTKRPAYEDL